MNMFNMLISTFFTIHRKNSQKKFILPIDKIGEECYNDKN